VLKTIRADLDKSLVADLNEIRVRGAVVSVVVSIRNTGQTKSKYLVVNQGKSGILSYDSGETAPAVSLDGYINGELQPGEVKTLRANFKVPKGAKKVAITLSGLGTFDDVDMAP
jgi:hypothetical protein